MLPWIKERYGEIIGFILLTFGLTLAFLWYMDTPQYNGSPLPGLTLICAGIIIYGLSVAQRRKNKDGE